VSETATPAVEAQPGQVVGTSVLRRDLYEKVTGAAMYTVDITPAGTAHAQVVRSDRAHARILGIDTAGVMAIPGVLAVVTAGDLQGLFPRFGHIVADHAILAMDVVRYYGEPVAIVVAETLAAAADAAELVVVDYEELPAVMTAEEALAPGAPLVHESSYSSSSDDSFAVLAATSADDASSTAPSNIAHEVVLEWGDVDACWAGAAADVTTTAHYPMLYAYAMEPYNAVATFADGELSVVSSAQHPYMVRTDLARIFGLALARVSVRAPYLGGGYGSKSYTKVEPMAAVASWFVGRTVKLVCSVEDAIYTTRADSAAVTVRSAFDAQGTIIGQQSAGPRQGRRPLFRALPGPQPAGSWPLGLHQHVAGVVVSRVRYPPGCVPRGDESGTGGREAGTRLGRSPAPEPRRAG